MKKTIKTDNTILTLSSNYNPISEDDYCINENTGEFKSYLYVQCGKAEWGYFIDIVGSTQGNFKNIDILKHKNNALTIARKIARQNNIPLVTDWGYKKDGGYHYPDDLTIMES